MSNFEDLKKAGLASDDFTGDQKGNLGKLTDDTVSAIIDAANASFKAARDRLVAAITATANSSTGLDGGAGQR